MTEGASYIASSSTRATDAWADEAAAAGHRGTQHIVAAGPTTAPVAVADALGLPERSPVVTRRRVVMVDDRPVELADAHYPIGIAGGTALAEPAKIRGGAAALLAGMGYVATEVCEEISARMPTDEERKVLHLSEAEPVLILTRISLTADGRAFEYAVMVMTAPGRVLRYRMRGN